MGVEALGMKMTYPEYLEHERKSDVRHEYLRGEVFAMAGGTPEHSYLATKMGTELSIALKGGSCRVFNSDLRVRLVETDYSCYPDVTVVCGELLRARDDKDAASNPTLVVEVLSESTEAHDRGAKLAHYRRLPSLKEIVLISQAPQRVEVWRRATGHFEVFEWGPGQLIELESVNAKIAVDELYRGMP